MYTLDVLNRIEPEPETQSDSPRRARQVTDPAARIAGPGRPYPGGTYDRAVRLINSSGHAWQVEDLVEALRRGGWDAQVDNPVETLRSALSRATRDRQIARQAKGVYGPNPSAADAIADEGQPVTKPDASEPGYAEINSGVADAPPVDEQVPPPAPSQFR